MEHAHAAVALMALAAAFAAAAASHAHEEASRAAAGGQGGAAVHSHVSVSGGRPAVATLSVANAGHTAVVSANATACGASGLLGRAAGDAEWSLRPGAAAAVSWAAPCAGGPVAVRVEYAMADGSTAAAVHRACAGGAGSCGPGWAGGDGWAAAGAPAPGRQGPDPAPAPAPAAAPTISSCTVSGLAATVCFNASAGGGGGGGGRGSSGTYTVLRLLVPGPPGYAAVGTVAAPGSGGAACHADAAPANSETATYRVAAAREGGSEPAPPQSRPARAYFAAQQCYVGTPDGERIGSPRGPPAPRPAAPSDYRVAMYTGLASTPLTVQAHFGADMHVAERQQDGSWLRLGYDPSHPRGALSDHLPAERIGRGASGDADVRYVRADLLRHLDEFWGARQ